MGKLLAPILMALVPPAAAFAALQTWAAAHPLRALAALLVWQALVWGFAAIGKLVGGTAEVLNEKWKVRLANAIDGVIGRIFSGYRGRYRKSVLSNLRFVDLKGLAIMGFYTPKLDEVFVDVSLVHSDPSKVPSDVLGRKPAESDRRFLGDLIDQPNPVVLAVIGAPGCGKTTLLRHTAMLVCKKRRRRPVPVLLYLRDHVEAIASGDPLTALIDSDAPAGWFERKLRAGSCVVLLDGLDEVANQDNRHRVSDWVEQQVTRYPDNDFVITSRPHGYQATPVSGAEIVQVRGFTDDQVTRFVHGWYLAFEQRSTQEKSATVTRLAEGEAKDLLERLRKNPALYELTVNPLLLTMIANVHKFRGALPGSRVDLYGEICEVLLWRRDESKKLKSELTGDQKMTLLSGLAHTMMARRIRDVSREQIATEFRSSLRRMTDELDEVAFLENMTSCGLLLERERDTFAFAHLTFQEYLAAQRIREKQATQVLVDNVDDVWWRETTLLHVASANADPVVKACLASGSVEALSLAFDCEEQGSELAPELRSDLNQLLEVATDPTADRARRDLMTRVVLSRYLRKLVRTGEGTHVCMEPVPARVYRLFLAQNPDRVPDAPLGDPDEPARGMWPDDVRAFSKWMNQVAGAEQAFRLGRRSEVMSSPLAAKISSLAPFTCAGVKEERLVGGNFTITHQDLLDDLRGDVELLFSHLLPAAAAFRNPAEPSKSARPHPHGSELRLLKLNVLPTASNADAVFGRALAKAVMAPAQTKKNFADQYLRALETMFDDDKKNSEIYVATLNSIRPVRAAQKAVLTGWGMARLAEFYGAVSAVLSRRTQLTPLLAAELRILAMCLELEAHNIFRNPFREVAIDVSVMQRRADGRLPANETIVLATD